MDRVSSEGRRKASTICFLSSEHPPLDKRVFHKEAMSLAGAGYEVIHLCPGPSEMSRNVAGVEIVCYQRKAGKLGRLANLLSLYRHASKLKADAYHCNEPDSWLVGVVLRTLKRKKCVFDCHEYYPGQVTRWLPRAFQQMGKIFTRVLLQILGLFTDVIVLAKQSVSEDFSWSRKKLVVVLNTSPLRELQMHPSEKSRSSEVGPFRFIHTGVIRKERGSEHLLQAMLQLSNPPIDYEVVIVGEFKDGSEDSFFATAEKLGIRDKIEFHRWMDFSAAFSLVMSADAGLILLQRGVENNVRAMPHKLFDYMLAGIPVIAPDFAPEVAGIVLDSESGVLVNTEDSDQIANAMRELVLDPHRSKTMGKKGREAALGRYNWEAEAEKLIGAYDKLLA